VNYYHYKFRSHPGRKSRSFGRLYSYTFLCYILFSSSFFLFIPECILYTHIPYMFISCSVTAFSIMYNCYTPIPNSRKHLHFQNKQQICVQNVFAGILAINIFLHQSLNNLFVHRRQLCRNNILMLYINN